MKKCIRKSICGICCLDCKESTFCMNKCQDQKCAMKIIVERENEWRKIVKQIPTI